MSMNHLTQAIELPSTSGVRSDPAMLNSSPAEVRRSEAGDKTVFILDAYGRIQFCSAPSLFAGADGNLRGHSIMHIVPTLPLREATLGYNIAYVRFSFSKDPWQRHAVRTAHGLLQVADVSLRPIPLERGYCLFGLIRLRESQDVETQFGDQAEPTPASRIARRRAIVPSLEECMDMINLRHEDLQAMGHESSLTEALYLLNRFSRMRGSHAEAGQVCYPNTDRRSSRPPKPGLGRHR